MVFLINCEQIQTQRNVKSQSSNSADSLLRKRLTHTCIAMCTHNTSRGRHLRARLREHDMATRV